MKTHTLARLLCCVALGFAALSLVTGCEDDDNDKNNSNSIPVTGSNVTTVLLGTWTGPAGSDQRQTTFMLNTYGVAGQGIENVSGQLTWHNGDKRFIRSANFTPEMLACGLSGTSSSATITDNWRLFYDGVSLSGQGTKSDGGTYAIYLTRQ
jgi:hypothetical protein